MLGLGVFLTGVCAEEVVIVNAGFESDAIEGPAAPVFEVLTDKQPEGWQYIPGESPASGLIAPNATTNQFYTRGTPGLEGANAYFVTGHGGIQQELTATLQPNTTYTLSVSSGTRVDGSNFGGYYVALDTVSGKLVGSWTGANRNIAPVGSFAPTQRSFTTGPSPPGKGEGLRITISQPAGPGGYTDLDDVKLTASPAAPRETSTPIDVFLVAGQSNALGWSADTSKLRSEYLPYAHSPVPSALLERAMWRVKIIVDLCAIFSFRFPCYLSSLLIPIRETTAVGEFNK